MSERTGLMKPGQTFFGGTPNNSTDGDPILGREVILRDRIRNYERTRVLRAVRNSAAAAVLPKRAVTLAPDGRSITGYGRLPSSRVVLVDEQLPAAGCAVSDICFVVMRGPALALTDLANYAADIAAGDYLNAQTAVTSGATTAGRVKTRTLTSSVTVAVTEQDGVFARAISSVLTNSTNNDILVDVNPIS